MLLTLVLRSPGTLLLNLPTLTLYPGFCVQDCKSAYYPLIPKDHYLGIHLYACIKTMHYTVIAVKLMGVHKS